MVEKPSRSFVGVRICKGVGFWDVKAGRMSQQVGRIVDEIDVWESTGIGQEARVCCLPNSVKSFVVC